MPYRHALRIAGVALLAGVTLALGGCGGAGPQLTAASLASGVTGGDADGGTTTVDRPALNPFGDRVVESLAGREVMKNPSVAEVMKPAGNLPEMAMGRADAPVTIIKYASMTCPYCRQFQREVFPELKRQYIDTGKVRFIIREFPIGFQSGAATVALRCAAPARQFELYDKLMSQQNAWVSQEVRTEPIMKVAAQVGITQQQFDACRANQGMIKELNTIKERGRTLGIVGTPNFFINGRLIKSTLTLADLKAIIDPILAGDSDKVAGQVAGKT